MPGNLDEMSENPVGIALARTWGPRQTSVLFLGITDEVIAPAVPEDDQNPAILLQRWQPVVTQVMLLGASDDYSPAPPVDDYMTVQVVDGDAQDVGWLIAMLAAQIDDPASGGGLGGGGELLLALGVGA